MYALFRLRKPSLDYMLPSILQVYNPSILCIYPLFTICIFPLCSSTDIADEANRKYNTHRCAVYQSDVRRAPRIMTMSH